MLINAIGSVELIYNYILKFSNRDKNYFESVFNLFIEQVYFSPLFVQILLAPDQDNKVNITNCD